MSSRSAIACLPALGLLLAAGCSRQAAAPVQANAAQTTGESADEATAAAAPDAKAVPVSGAVDRSHRGDTLPDATLTDLDGKPATLPLGKPRLVNLWATWCAPCVAELPALDRAAVGMDAIALNQGEDAAKVRSFLLARKLTHLRPLLDAGMTVSMALPANLPTTILYDAGGKEMWRVTGARDWASTESRALLAEAR